MQYNIINNCHILAAANTTRPILTSIGPVWKGDQIRSVVTMTHAQSLIGNFIVYSRLYKYMCVLDSDLGHHMRLFIYKCSRFKLCGTGRATSDVLPCSSGGWKTF